MVGLLLSAVQCLREVFKDILVLMNNILLNLFVFVFEQDFLDVTLLLSDS